MAKRIVVTKMVTMGDERLPRVALYTGNFRSWSIDDSDLCVCQAAFQSLAGILNDTEAVVLDELTFGASWGTIPQARRNQITPAVKALGFVDFGPRTTDSMKQVVESLIHYLVPGVNIELGDVQDPWG